MIWRWRSYPSKFATVRPGWQTALAVSRFQVGAGGAIKGHLCTASTIFTFQGKPSGFKANTPSISKLIGLSEKCSWGSLNRRKYLAAKDIKSALPFVPGGPPDPGNGFTLYEGHGRIFNDGRLPYLLTRLHTEREWQRPRGSDAHLLGGINPAQDLNMRPTEAGPVSAQRFG